MLVTLAVAVAVVVATDLVQERVGLDLADEGFLWNGILRTASGLVPIRDFKSYDPGRFYWGVVTTRLFGRGILGVRRSVSLFSVLGVWAGLEVVRALNPATWHLIVVALFVVWWMQPRHKRFDVATSLMAVFFLLQVLERPTAAMFFSAGVFVGFAGVMGRNHGLYSAAAALVTAAFAWLRLDTDGVLSTGASFVAGVMLGYCPSILLWLLVPGYLRTYWNDKILIFWQRGSTNLRRPVPWPWRRDLRDQLPHSQRLATLLLGVHLLALPSLYLGSLGWALVADVGPTWAMIAAGSVVGLMYTHHAFSRADAAHLCQASGPYVLVLVGWVSLAPTLLALAIAVVVVAATVLTTASIVPLVRRVGRSSPLEPFDANGDRLLLPSAQAAFLAEARRAIDEAAAPDEAVFIAPHYAALYPLLGRATPVHSDYLIFAETDERQRRLIANLEAAGVRVALISDARLDDRDDLRFSRTHPLVWEYLHSSYEVVEQHALGVDHLVFRRVGVMDSET